MAFFFFFSPEQLLLPLGLCLSFFHVSQSDAGNSLGSPLYLNASRFFFFPLLLPIWVWFCSILKDFLIFFFCYHKVDLPGARRQQGAPRRSRVDQKIGLWVLISVLWSPAKWLQANRVISLASRACPAEWRKALWVLKVKAIPVCSLVLPVCSLVLPVDVSHPQASLTPLCDPRGLTRTSRSNNGCVDCT